MADTYRMKPVEAVEAMQVGGDARRAEQDVPSDEMIRVAEWIGGQVTVGHDRQYEVEVPVGREGAIYAREGEWVVQHGDQYTVVSDENFQRLYVKVGGPPSK